VPFSFNDWVTWVFLVCSLEIFSADFDIKHVGLCAWGQFDEDSDFFKSLVPNILFCLTSISEVRFLFKFILLLLFTIRFLFIVCFVFLFLWRIFSFLLFLAQLFKSLDSLGFFIGDFLNSSA